MFYYFPGNYMWSSAVTLSMMAGGQLGQIDRWLAPLRDAEPDGDAWTKAWDGAAAQQEEHAEEDVRLGFRRSATARYLRASTYYLAASTGELGATLRSWRDRLTPDELGLPAATRRRARGLRRQEVAQLAGFSLDYLVQLEQGRATGPSPQVLTALARALRLTETERDHLFQLADQAVPGERHIHHALPGSVRRLVEQLPASPAAVYDVRWNPITWNAMWVAAMGDLLNRPERERNMAWRYFTGLPARVVRSPREQLQFEGDVVADLRWSFGRYPADRRLAQLIADLRDASPRFRSLWETRRVGV